MRFVILSDTHMQHAGVTIPDGDVLIFCGDMCTSGKLREAITTINFLNELPHTYKIIVAGNHDFPFQFFHYSAVVPKEIHYLCDSYIHICLKRGPEKPINLKVYGMPWTPDFYNWAFMLPRDSERMQYKVDAIPDDVDILVTHGPPYGILDMAPKYVRGELVAYSSEGCKLLKDAVTAIRPKLHVFGHIHNQHGSIVFNDTLFINSALCDDSNNLICSPIVVDYVDGEMRVI